LEALALEAAVTHWAGCRPGVLPSAPNAKARETRIVSIGDMVMLAIGDQSVRAEVEDEDATNSLHTGRPLRTLRVSFDVQGDALNDAIVEGLNSEDRITVDDGTAAASFEKTNNTWSYTSGVSIYHHNVELREVEDVKPTSVGLLGVDLVPYEYEERVDRGGILIEMKVRVTQPENELLEQQIATDDFFPVVRHGIEDRPREMRFGKCIWSEDGEHIKQSLVLVEKVVDETPSPFQGWFEPESHRTQEMTAGTRELLNALLGLLAEKNVLSNADIEDIRKRAETGFPRRIRQLYRADDIDEET
jgi:hypothetical protein